ncbi:MAG: hypothetical protein HWQ38_18985 [Nostoc sp. NMS7]|uniref:SNF2-related protein n=1 Tax=Nostoc sp. NMS7 TaxID=2815391 RepID=UPI0025E2A06F|nr:SNF2-related protein [Nostoc sp. NMS7]MBN3948422.1 hypothetical protein [Nostoc sp. NMS7]
MQLFNVVDAHRFLSGDILEKLRNAESAIAFDPTFEEETRVLKKILPLPIAIADVDIAIGATWIPTRYYEQFCKQVFDVDVTFYFSPMAASWDLTLSNGGSQANQITYGYSYVKRGEKEDEVKVIPAVGDRIENGLFTMAMHFKVPAIADPTSRREAFLKQEELRKLWSQWCKEGERGSELEKIYNHKFNRLVLPNWDNTAPAGFKDILRASGMSETWIERLRPYQLDSIWRMAISGNSLLGLEVGLGKTAASIATIMLRKHYKTSTKALVIVQKSTLSDWRRAFQEMYPRANVLCADPDDCSGKNRQKFLAKAAFWNHDAIVITHESFKAIPTRIETERVFVERQLCKIAADLEDLYAKGETSQKKGKKRGNRIVKKLEEMRDKLYMHLEKILAWHDVGIHFEDINPSMLAVDECQRYKNNYFATRIQAKGINLTVSQRSEDFDLKLSFMRSKYPANNFLLMITGTPEPTNSMTGVYVFQSYLQPEELEKRGLAHFDAWAVAFGRVVSKIEAGVGGGLQTSDRFAEFINVPELLQMYLSVCHIKRFDDVAGQAGFTRPTHRVFTVGTPLSEFQIKAMEWIALRGKYIDSDEPMIFEDRDTDGCLIAPATKSEENKKVKGKRLTHPSTGQPITEVKEAIALGLKWGKKVDNHLWTLTDARKLMIAPQLIDPEEPFVEGDKISQCVTIIYSWWRKTKKQRSTQLVFLDWGTPGGSCKIILYDWMRDRLIAKGIPKEEIAFIQDYSKDEDKSELFKEVNKGDVRVLFGSTEPLGIGVNVQKKIKVVHFVDIPRRPDQYEQRLGRAERSGNENDKLIVYQYLTKGQKGNFGADAAQMGLLETKMKSREQILRGDLTVRRVVEDDDTLLLFMMQSAHATGDARFGHYMKLKGELEQEESRASLLMREINRLNIGTANDSLPTIKNNIGYVKTKLEECSADVELARQHLKDASPDRFLCTVENRTYLGKDPATSIPEREGEYGPANPLTVKQAQKLADAHFLRVIESLAEDTRTRSNSERSITSDPKVIGEFGGMLIYCKIWASSDGETINLWLKGSSDRYDFKYRVSEQRLIRNMVEVYCAIANKDSYLKERLEKLTKELEASTEQLVKKRGDRDAIVKSVQALKQEKAFLESELSIKSDL